MPVKDWKLQSGMQMAGITFPFPLLSPLKLKAEQFKTWKPCEPRLKAEPERFPKSFLCPHLPFQKGL